uniref:Uncharacterized protein n=1 Tax=Romanomermis culicivorax TaxID=13658 RepID=A0A915IP43_ROMCU
MNIVNDYIIYKLLFGQVSNNTRIVNKKFPPVITVGETSLSDHSHLSPLKQRLLHRKRSGSWSAGLNEVGRKSSMVTIAEAEEINSRAASLCRSIHEKNLPTSRSHSIISHDAKEVVEYPYASSPQLNHDRNFDKFQDKKPDLSRKSGGRKISKTDHKKVQRKRSNSCPDSDNLSMEDHNLTTTMCSRLDKCTLSTVASSNNFGSTNEINVECSAVDKNANEFVTVTVRPTKDDHVISDHLRVCRLVNRDDNEFHDSDEGEFTFKFFAKNNEWSPKTKKLSYSRQQQQDLRRKISKQKDSLFLPDEDDLDNVFEDGRKISAKSFHSVDSKNCVRRNLLPYNDTVQRSSEPTLLENLKSPRTKTQRNRRKNDSLDIPMKTSPRKSYQDPTCGSKSPRLGTRHSERDYGSTADYKPIRVKSPEKEPARGNIKTMGASMEEPAPKSPNKRQMIKDTKHSVNSVSMTNDRAPTSIRNDKKSFLRSKQCSVVSIDITSIPEILVGLNYSPSIGFVTLNLIKVSGLPSAGKTSFAKVTLFEDGKVTECKQTNSVSCDPNRDVDYKQAYMFGLGCMPISKVQIIIEIDKLWISTTQPQILPQKVGQIALGLSENGNQSFGTGHSHWLQMMKQNGYPTAVWHQLDENEDQV